jgi:hypothetical protein
LDERPPLDLRVVQMWEHAIAADIAGSLRRAATEVEAETAENDRTVAIIAVQVAETGRVRVYGWGKTDKLRAIGALTLGIAEVGQT